jgi:hypothetical protein
MNSKFVAAWLLLLLASFTLTASIGAAIATALSPGMSLGNEAGILIQAIVALIIIYSSILILRNRGSGVRGLSVVLLVLALAAFFESLFYSLRQQEFQYFMVSLIFEVLPLIILILCLRPQSQKEQT